MVYNFIPRGQAFKILMTAESSFSQSTSYNIEPNGQTNLNAGVIRIAKDDGSFVAATNPAVFVTGGAATLQLTASEMDADKIDVYISANAGGGPKFIMSANILTVPTELNAAPTASSSFAAKLLAVFQYLFYRRTVTSTVETLYKADSTTVVSSNTVSDNGTTFDKGKQV